ncbi:hypothetical protein R6Q59_011199, partial [Mikania micrantha]
ERLEVINGCLNVKFCWNVAALTPDELSELHHLSSLLNSASLSLNMDRWSWSLEDTGSFSVKSIKSQIESLNCSQPS